MPSGTWNGTRKKSGPPSGISPSITSSASAVAGISANSSTAIRMAETFGGRRSHVDLCTSKSRTAAQTAFDARQSAEALLPVGATVAIHSAVTGIPDRFAAGVGAFVQGQPNVAAADAALDTEVQR